MSKNILLSANYLPPVSYFHIIKQHVDATITIDQHEHFPKQTYRNRARIATANGVLDLIVPIQHGRKERVAMKDVLINYDHDWQRLHWLSIQTAYRSSAYFEYYEHDFEKFYTTKFESLLTFNLEQLKLIFKCLKQNNTIDLSSSYEKNFPETEVLDFRDIIHPKKESVHKNAKPYYQLFEDRHGFISDLSIIDLIFNQGPQSKNFL